MTETTHRPEVSPEVSIELVEEAVAYVRDELGGSAAASIGQDASSNADALLDAVCVLTCADRFPPDPLGQAMIDGVTDRFATSDVL